MTPELVRFTPRLRGWTRSQMAGEGDSCRHLTNNCTANPLDLLNQIRCEYGNVGETDRARQTQCSRPLVPSMPSGLHCAAGVLLAFEGRLAGGSLVPVLRSIKWAAHAQSGIGNGLYVDHGRADVLVTHELLHRTHVVSGPQHLGSEGSA